MKTSKELKEEKRSLFEKSKAITDEVEKREDKKFTDDEQKNIDDYEARMDALDIEIARAEKLEKRQIEMAGQFNKDRTKQKELREVKDYNIVKAIRSLLPNQVLDGLEKEMHDEAVKENREIGQELAGIGVPLIIMEGENRDHTAGTTTEGGYTIDTSFMGFIEPLKNKLVFKELGAKFMTGLKGNGAIPVGGAVDGAWEGETDDNAETSSTFDKLSISPNRYGAYSDFSKQLLFQSSYGVQDFVKNEILSAIAQAVQLAAIEGTTPEGILSTTGIGAVYAGGATVVGTNENGAAMIYDDLVNLEQEVAIDNADIGSLGFLTNTKVRAALKKTKLDTGSGLYVWNSDNTLLGHKVAVTNAVPYDLTKGSGTGLSAAIFGNFNDLLIAQWGGLDIVVDPYTKATNAMIRLVINSWWDVLVKRAQSFAAVKDIIA